ncbi:MAG: amidophosphoribosyltransferase [Tolumonas sp.]|uniref:amidophosphoribosyltransferase n=1 Tax=uncultured Tolumonas sp. TaxID=263765 RepID=UPI002A0A4C15|nr:amidophosphoribosyltransferase [uncultured Tolumonas sp.]MDD2343022.1 amidophosphoribosyltransferase [Tolumonas sp.]MDD2841082.1 amidophosphoribosyltransferase [Tolumonas sp.]
MCGIVGIVGTSPVNQALYDSLTVLQHRGQDAAGIVTISDNTFKQRKANGLVKDVFETRHMQRLKGNIGIGHVRYPTAGSSSAAEAQPFYVNSPFGIALAHNGNLTNAKELRDLQTQQTRRHINTTSDSEVLLNTFAYELDKTVGTDLSAEEVFAAVSRVHAQVRGAYAVVAVIIGHGLLAFRDPNGIRPLVLGRRASEENGRYEYMVASESVALDVQGFEVMRDVAPGEAVYISAKGELSTKQCAHNPDHCPCIFEYVYFARPDSFIDKVSVYAARVHMGQKLGAKIARDWKDLDIDVVIPIPETSCDIALEIAQILNKPYRQGFVKNRYIGRTFIMPGQTQRKKSVRNKLNAISSEFKGKNVLLVDDSIVRGTTSAQIVDMAREAGAEKVYFASAAPEIRFPNVYGIDMPVASELIAYGREVNEICQLIRADGLIFQDLSDLEAAVRECNPEIKQFETSVFNGKYITGDINDDYLAFLNNLRNDDAKADREWSEATADLELYNGEN